MTLQTTKPPNGARAAPPPPQPRASRLADIKRGQLRRPLRCLFYGIEGGGKSSLAADAPDPVFLDFEGGADNITAARYPFHDGIGGHVPRTYEDVLAALDDLATNPHDYKTVVLDTVDALEALIHRHICAVHKQSSVESFGYGKGFQVALDVFRMLLIRLDALRDRGMTVILIGHSFIKAFKNPLGEDYDRYQLRIHEKAAGVVKEWCDIVGFIHFEEGSAKLQGDTAQTKRARGFATGRRIIELAREAAWDAKSRLALPTQIELGQEHPWAPFAAAQADARDTTDDDMRHEVEVELTRLGAEFTKTDGASTTSAAVREQAATADRSTLTRMLSGLRSIPSIDTAKES